MENQKSELLSFIETERQKGRPLSEVLGNLKVARSTYYRWQNPDAVKAMQSRRRRRRNPRKVTEEEKTRIDQMKTDHPEMRHRQIQGMLQLEEVFVSSSTVYQHLKARGQVEPFERRAAPWKEPHYEIVGANLMWGTDWTKLRIGGMRWYLLTLIDFFSRLIVEHEIIPTVNAGHIKGIYEKGLEQFNLPLDWPVKPELRADRGSPNTSKVTKGFFKDIGADLSFARVSRPTDNAITERFYRTIKQEEIYVVGDYQDLPTAKEVIGEYIKWYNEKRPHQALWNFTPLMVHEMNNKTQLLNTLRELKRKTWTDRREYWMDKKNKN